MLTKLDDFYRFMKQFRVLMSAFVLIMFPAVYLLVYLTGGVQYVYPYTMFVPVLLAAFLYGAKGGITAGIIGGLLLGPIMPVDTADGTMQSTLNWLYRLFFYAGIGGMTGLIIFFMKNETNRSIHASTHHHGTGLPNLKLYDKTRGLQSESKDKAALTVKINNRESLVILLGRESYFNVLKNLHETMVECLPKETVIVQVDEQHFWIELPHVAYERLNGSFVGRLEDKTYFSNEVPLFLDFSVGASLGREKKTAESRFAESDIAALHAKTRQMKYVVYHETQNRDRILLTRLGELPFAMKNEALFLEYQPLIDLKTGEIIGFEALVRWHRNDVVLMPGDFIPHAEKTRVIDQLTKWVLTRVLEDYPRFSAVKPDITIALNLSQRNLFDPVLIEEMLAMIKAADLPKGAINLELTESTLMLNRNLTQSFLEAFRQIGVSSILDDFGNGYSSLSCLRDLPVDKVKIDRGFTLNLNVSVDTRYLVKTIIDLAHKMDLVVIAEGVEDPEILERLKTLGCDFVQGFHFSKPLRLEKAIEYLETH